LLKIQINSKKTKFWKEKISWERGNTWKAYYSIQAMISFYIWAVQNIDTYIAKQCSHVEFPYFVMGSHKGQRHKPHYLTRKIKEDNK